MPCNSSCFRGRFRLGTVQYVHNHFLFSGNTMTYDSSKKLRQPPIRESIISLDKDILRLLARRSGMLDRLSARKGHIDPREEKELRAAWEKHAGRMSRDIRLTRQMFSLLQEIEFLPRPAEGEERRPAFNLAPVRRPVDVRMSAPLAGRRSRLYLTLAAVAGAACHISPSLLGDPDVEFVKMFNQAGTSLAWDEDGTLRAREGGGLTLADKVIYVGDDALNFHLLLGQYVGHPSRAKFTGESGLKLADLSALRQFLPQLGVRLVNAVPKSDGLPVRIECSGVLPDVVAVPASLSVDAVTGLLMGAPFWQRPAAFNLDAHPQAQDIIHEAVDVLRQCAADVSVQGTLVRVAPSTLQVPLTPPLGMDLALAASLLALPAAAGGQVRLEGRWPQCAVAQGLQTLLQQAGTTLRIQDEAVIAESAAPAGGTLDASALPPRFAPLALACAALSALRGKPARLPLLPAGVNSTETESFLQHIGLEADEGGALRHAEQPQDTDNGWAAPSPAWGMALALTAFARPGIKLANPGVMTALYPAFWSLYNALPCPELKKVVEPAHEKPVRRRIIAADAEGTGSGDSDS